MKNITLIVLAAGAGKRFWPFTTNKALFPFFGLPMFAQTIADIPADISRMIIVTNPANDATIRSYRFPIDTEIVVQKEPSGMADAVLQCRSSISEGPLLIVNADDIVDPSLLSDVIAVAKKSDAFGVVTGRKTSGHGPFGYLAFDNGRVSGIVEKPSIDKQPSQYVYLVCDYIRHGKELFDEIEKTKSGKDDVLEKVLTALMTRHAFAWVRYEGYFAPLKYPWHVLDVMQILSRDLVSHKGKGVEIKKNVIIEGPVYIEDGVKIFENSKIVGPCYIGKNTIIGNNCIIRQSHIGQECVVGFNCDITRSYIGDNCWFHTNYIGDSVLEGNISMGAGAALANLRLDDGEIKETGKNKLGAMIGRGTRIGVNASIMPGVKIGKNCFIGSGVILEKDLPEDSFCMMKPGYTIIKNLKSAPESREAFKKKI